MADNNVKAGQPNYTPPTLTQVKQPKLHVTTGQPSYTAPTLTEVKQPKAD
jgi:hypothetical protein